MKMMRLIVVVAATLCTGTLSSQAHGCGLGFYLGIPFVSFGLGLGLGAAYSCPAYYGGCAYQAYTCDPPAYYNYMPSVATAPAPPPAPPAPPAPLWEPSTPGAGHWVPDPEPYSYTPVPAPKKTADVIGEPARTVTTVQSPGGVRVYIVNR